MQNDGKNIKGFFVRNKKWMCIL